ncbi:hypothetical protein [Robertmurraya andreesenii]|uniref:O-antigen/teichoic acid export membrane protein n=1 Tax=Anoxybacillus andreesenii TaxID=1325932 RepID=A0ABT9V360_9BACL|nr:hypothetical protein [Robertmurraya andreesenii]MDQ0155371.1 O-antigen/teichoic acid export membrane protein [Robertmurraya andreesenii]
MAALKNFINIHVANLRDILNAYAVNIKNIVYFFMPSIIGLFINLITFPIFSKNFSSFDFAVTGYFDAIAQIFLPIMNLSFYSFYMKDFFKRSDEENKEVRATLVMFLSFINICIILVGLILLFIYFNSAKVTFPIFPYGILSLGAIYFSIFVSFLGIDYKLRKQGLKFFILQSISVVLPIIFGLYLVIIFNLGASGRMIGSLLAQIILGIVAIKIMFKKVKFDFQLIKKALSFCFPLILIALLDIPTTYIDRLILERQNDIDSFALYNIGLKMSGILFALGSAVYQAFEPDLYKNASKKRFKNFLQIVGLVFGFLIVVNIIFSIFSEPFISLLTSGRYTDSYQFAKIMIWSNFFLLLSYALTVILIVQDKSKSLLSIQIMVAVAGIFIFLLFIDNWEFLGASYAMIIIKLFNCAFLVIFIWFSIRKLKSKEVKMYES